MTESDYSPGLEDVPAAKSAVSFIDGKLAQLKYRGIPVETLSSVAYRKARGGKISKPGEPLAPWRLEYDSAVARLLQPYDFELGVMFGYMLIATKSLYDRYTFINDHPALPDGPIGTYQEVIAELIRTRAHDSGCLMNVVTGDVDRGAPVSFCRYAIRDSANATLWQGSATLPADLKLLAETALYAEIRARGVKRERPFLVETLRALAAGSLSVPPRQPIDLTGAVEAIVGAS